MKNKKYEKLCKRESLSCTSTWLDEETKERFRIASQKEGRSMASNIAFLIKQYLNGKGSHF